jgi:hypothetical protein
MVTCCEIKRIESFYVVDESRRHLGVPFGDLRKHGEDFKSLTKILGKLNTMDQPEIMAQII